MVRIIFLHCFRAAVLMLILTSAVSHASTNSLKTLRVQIDVNITWNLEHKQGSLSMQINGTMELDPGSVRTPAGHALVPVMLRYPADGLTGDYTFRETETDTDGEQICHHSGSGSLNAVQSSLMRVVRIKHLTSPNISKLSPDKKQYLAQMPGNELLIDYYDFSCAFAKDPRKVSGECGKKEKRITKKSIYFGNMLLGFKIPDSGEMKGHRSWMASRVGSFSLSDLPEKMRRPAYHPEESPGGGVTYNVTWAFGKAVKPFDVNVSTVSFNYTGDENSLQLLHHAPETPVKPPEWNNGGKNQPAAFVRNYHFPVKVVFNCGRPVKSANAETFHAIEKVFKGKGFGGKLELKPKGGLTITGNQISGEFIIETAQDVVGTHRVQWDWKGEVEFKDEPGLFTLEFGKTEHTIHIVGDIPTKETNAFKYAVELGCEWAEGLKDGQPVLDEIWKNFWDIPPPKDNPNQGSYLSYKHFDVIRDTTTDELLTEGGGNCGAWADFFKDTVGIHGIQVDKISIYPKKAGMTIPEKIFDLIVANDVPAQGNLNPSRVFTEHALNKYNGIYYDPSYHEDCFVSLNEYENSMFHGYCDSLKKDTFLKKGHDCGYIDHPKPAQEEALVSDCLIKEDDAGTGCVPNSNECEVYEKIIDY